ncbi:MAG: hypothetical protein K2Q09_10075, partial [Phycisphaerales bacterium]|nr:hypothetical protein [Phycisphaerales bacterium]
MKQTAGHRLGHSGLLHILLLAAIACNLVVALASWDGGLPSCFELLSFLFFNSSGITLLLDWFRLADRITDKRLESDGFLSLYWQAQKLLNTLLFGGTAAAVIFVAGSRVASLFLCNAISLLLLSF